MRFVTLFAYSVAQLNVYEAVQPDFSGGTSSLTPRVARRERVITPMRFRNNMSSYRGDSIREARGENTASLVSHGMHLERGLA